MSFNVKSNSSVKEVVTPGDRRGYTKLYGSIDSFWTTTITLNDNIYNYSRIVIVGHNGEDDNVYKYYNLNYDIIPGLPVFVASQMIIMYNGTNITHAIISIKNCSFNSNSITLTGQFRKNDTVNGTMAISAIYGIK